MRAVVERRPTDPIEQPATADRPPGFARLDPRPASTRRSVAAAVRETIAESSASRSPTLPANASSRSITVRGHRNSVENYLENVNAASVSAHGWLKETKPLTPTDAMARPRRPGRLAASRTGGAEGAAETS